MLNSAPPKIDPNGINYVEADVLVPAKIAVNTSGAPFANAKNVTPAKVGEISKLHNTRTESWNNIFYCWGQGMLSERI